MDGLLGPQLVAHHTGVGRIRRMEVRVAEVDAFGEIRIRSRALDVRRIDLHRLQYIFGQTGVHLREGCARGDYERRQAADGQGC